MAKSRAGRCRCVCAACLHRAVVGPAAALGGCPDDVLHGVFDVAGFAVYAVLCVDLQALAAVGSGYKFVYTSGAVAAFSACIEWQVGLHGHAGIFQGEVGRLVFFVVGVA